LPPPYRLFKGSRLCQVPRQKLGFYWDPVGKIGFEHDGDTGVKFLTAPPQQAIMGGVFDKRVLEEITRIRRAAAAVNEAGSARMSRARESSGS
jgi:hypothetical protein